MFPKVLRSKRRPSALTSSPLPPLPPPLILGNGAKIETFYMGSTSRLLAHEIASLPLPQSDAAISGRGGGGAGGGGGGGGLHPSCLGLVLVDRAMDMAAPLSHDNSHPLDIALAAAAASATSYSQLSRGDRICDSNSNSNSGPNPGSLEAPPPPRPPHQMQQGHVVGRGGDGGGPEGGKASGAGGEWAGLCGLDLRVDLPTRRPAESSSSDGVDGQCGGLVDRLLVKLDLLNPADR
jgi:hypothetical protein